MQIGIQPKANLHERIGDRRPIFPDDILEVMDHLEVLRQKIGALRAEIAQLQGLNEQYRRVGRHDTLAQVAHGQRQERLQEIQQELTQLADLGRRVRSVEQMKEQHRSRPYLVKKVS